MIIGLNGCDFSNLLDTNFENISTSPLLVMPLGHGELSFQDFLNDSDSTSLKVYADGPNKDVIYLDYQKTLKTTGIRDLLTFTDRDISQGFTLNPSGSSYTFPSSSNDQPIPGNNGIKTLSYDLNFNPEKLTEVLFTAGTLRLTSSVTPTNSSLPSLQATIVLPGFTKNGQALQVVTTTNQTSQISLAGYKAVLNNNRFDASFTIIVKKSQGGTKTIPNGARFNNRIQFTSVQFDYLKGFFGEQISDLPEETLPITIFENAFKDGNLSLADPKASIVVVNEYGIPTQVSFTSLVAKNATGSLNVQLSPTSPLNANIPIIMGDSAFTTVTITNAQNLINFNPTEIYYKARATINKGLTTGANFCKNESKLKIRLAVEVPLIGSASNISISDTLDLDVSDLNNSEIETASIRINANNNLPFDANLQIYLLDENLIVLDSLLDSTNGANKVVVGAETDAEGTPVAPGVFEGDFIVSKEKFNKLFSAKKILLFSTLQTSDQPKNVKFRANDKLSIKLGLKVKVKLNVDL